jgi:hypothetical protein
LLSSCLIFRCWDYKYVPSHLPFFVDIFIINIFPLVFAWSKKRSKYVVEIKEREDPFNKGEIAISNATKNPSG